MYCYTHTIRIIQIFVDEYYFGPWKTLHRISLIIILLSSSSLLLLSAYAQTRNLLRAPKSNVQTQYYVIPCRNYNNIWVHNSGVKLGQYPRRLQEVFAYYDSVIMKSVIQRQFRLVFIAGIALTFTTKIPYGFISLNYIIGT